MLYDYDLTIPAGTPASSPLVAKAHLIAGTLTQIRVMFPPGPATLVHVAIRDKSFQLMPVNPDGDMNFDDQFITSVMQYPLTDAPYDLDILGWSPDAVFAHTITCQFEVQPLPDDTWSKFIEQLFTQGQARPGRR